MSSTYGRKQQAAAMAHVDREISKKVTVQVSSVRFNRNRNLEDGETQTEISIALSSPANFKENSASSAFLTAPKLPDVFCDKTVHLRELSFRTWETPLLGYNTNKRSYRGHKLQPLSQECMEQQTMSKGACKSSLKATLSQKFHSAYIKSANHSIENLTDNGELETCDGQLLLTTSTSLSYSNF